MTYQQNTNKQKENQFKEICRIFSIIGILSQQTSGVMPEVYGERL